MLKRGHSWRGSSLGENGPLSLLTMKLDGSHYLRLDRATYLIGLLGLNELVKAHKGMELHDSKEALEFGIKVVEFIKMVASKLGEEEGIRVALNQTPAESTSYRFARLDMRHHPAVAGRAVKGEIGRGEIYYTNSTHLSPSAPISPIDKAHMEGRFHNQIDANPLTSVWLGGSKPKPHDIVELLRRIREETDCSQVMITPDFTLCQECGQSPGDSWETAPNAAPSNWTGYAG